MLGPPSLVATDRSILFVTFFYTTAAAESKAKVRNEKVVKAQRVGVILSGIWNESYLKENIVEGKR